jgi:cytochrome c556
MAFTINPTGAANMLSVKEIMGRLNKRDTSLLPTLGRELKQPQPAWDEIQRHTKEFADLAQTLSKNDPPRGQKDSWEKLTKEYAQNAKSMDEAASRKDQKGAQMAHAKLAAACKSCHDAHRNPGS